MSPPRQAATPRLIVLAKAVAAVYGVTLVLLRLGGSLRARLEEGKVHIVHRA